MINACGVEGGGTAFDPVDFVAFFQEQFSEIGAVLASDPSDKGDGAHVKKNDFYYTCLGLAAPFFK